MHLVEDLCEVFAMYDFGVLYFEEILAAMAIHVYKYLCALVSLNSLGLWKFLIVPSSYQVKHCLMSEIFLLVVQFNIFAIEILTIVQVEI